MKQLYKIGTKQEFTYATLRFFKKNIKTEEGWVVRNVKYVYANSPEEAKEKYLNWFFKEYRGIIKGWRNWYCGSDNLNLFMEDKYIDITSTKTVLIDAEKDIDVNYETLRENMQAENFKEWWFDNV